MSDFSVTVTVRNGRLLRAIRAKYGSAAEMARQTGLRATEISALLTMRRSPLAHGDWSDLAFDVSSALHCEPEDLWPAHIAKIKLAKNQQEMDMSLAQIEGLLSAPGEAEMARAMLRKWIAKADLTDRHKDVLSRRLAGATLKECAKDHGLNPERIRQIECRAIEKIERIARLSGAESVEDAI